MTQYLITTFTDSTGQTFTEATKARENQTFSVVLAESKEEALSKYKKEVFINSFRLANKGVRDFRNKFGGRINEIHHHNSNDFIYRISILHQTYC
ncbi:DUF1381 domain-containing protein [Staphylococcus pseudintermedius]|nr:DUF1381 domain-containing protein [Staphylococcus pseudintermedius]EHT7951662.1 DUF1381 domain-containing protein [Staphylococcus pseudintermedius]EJL9336682.1 DUF1381 domain-containing protein [Staphylococcus pseudintermedius]EKF6275124.1 DUF1381 domain-containing protein [Staphylococcus pseudintermedius]EKH2246228.1 DUF1381 domain-containing protein [Staphylococcus pseudintermedius]